MINLATSYLISFDIVRSTSITDDKFFSSWTSDSGRIEAGYDIIDYRLGWIGWSRLRKVSDSPGDLLGEASNSIYFHSRKMGDYRTREAIICLSQAQLQAIIEKKNSTSVTIDNFVEALLPVESSNRVWPSGTHPRFGRILLTSLSDSATSPEGTLVRPPSESWVRELNSFFDKNSSAIIPSLLADVVLLGSVWVATPEDQLTVVWLEPHPQNAAEGSLSFPRSVVNLIEFMVTTHIVGHLSARLEQLPLGKLDVLSYLHLVVPHRASVVGSYLEKHLSDREKTLGEIIETAQIFNDATRILKESPIRKLGLSTSRAIYSGIVDHRLKYDSLSYLARLGQEALDKYNRVKGVLEAKDTSVKDYLRDFLAAEVASTNLQIQQRIRTLTTMATFVGAIAVLLAIVPDSVKSYLWQSIVSLFQ